MSTTKKSPSLNEAVSSELKKGFDLNKFKDKKLLNSNVKFKEQKWIPVSEAVQEALGIPGIPMGHITLLRGHSNAGKTTALIEAAVSAQKAGILPVFIITEMKWSWEHLKQMGFKLEDIKDEQGNVVNHTGFFIYTDRTALQTIEDVAAFIVDLLDEQKKGNLPYDLLFMWDSIGSIPCKMSVEANKNNAIELETQCGKIPKDACAYTSCCVLLGGSKCVAGNQSGPTMKANYSDVSVLNRDYYYYQGKCYGNC